MKYVISKENKGIIKEVDDALIADYIATGEWEETTKEEFDVAMEKFVSKPKKVKDEL